jgi:tRNA A37 threonylcarbamoyladenosine dehydratase
MRLEADLERRFAGLVRLYGEAGMAAIRAAHVAVAGVGGVGSWAAEALARSQVGKVTLIDLDMVAESNTNRQIQALGDEYGKPKVEVMATRMLAINPACAIHCIEDFLTPENLASHLGGGIDVLIDAIDQARVKAAMIAHCQKAGIAIVTVGAAGGQTDPTCIRRDDLARSVQDPLLARVRSLLRRQYGFAAAPRKFGVPAIFSQEAVRRPPRACDGGGRTGGLSCAGYGSSMCVTAPMGCAASATALDLVIRRAAEKSRAPASTPEKTARADQAGC